MDEWRSELAELVGRGCRSYGDAEVRAALEEVIAEFTRDRGSVPALTPVVAVLGLSSCEAGWVGILVRPTSQTTLHVGSSLMAVTEQIRDQEPLGCVGVVSGSRRGEVEQWLAARPTVEVIELAEPDADPETLADAGLTLPPMYSGMGFTLNELRIAGAATIAASRLFT